VALSASRSLRSKCLNVVDVLDWACLAPRPQTVSQGLVAMPSRQRSTSNCLNAKHSPYLGDSVSEAMYKQGEGGMAENSDLALHEESLAKRKGVKLARVKIWQKGRRAAKATKRCKQTKWAMPATQTPHEIDRS
jgi:hypothetical protein